MAPAALPIPLLVPSLRADLNKVFQYIVQRATNTETKPELMFKT